MNPIVKAAVRKEVIAEVGNKLDDTLEEAKRDISRYEGAKRELLQAMKGIMNLHKTLDGEFDSGKTIRDGMEAKEVRDLCKRWIDRAHGICINLAESAAVMEQQSQGKAAALEDSVSYAKKLFDVEVGREQAIIQAMAEEDDEPSPPRRGRARSHGSHPGMSTAQRRRAEEAAAKEVSKGNGKPVEEMTEAELEAELLG